MVRRKACNRHKKVHPDPRPKLPNIPPIQASTYISNTLVSVSPSQPSNHPTAQSPYIELPLCSQSPPQPSRSVLVLCSLSSSTPDLELVSVLVAELTTRHIRPQAPTHTPVRELSRQWLQHWVWEADAVLLFCNRQFFEEWSSKRDGEGYPCIGLWMSQLINSVPNFNKFAYVYAEEANREFCNLKSILMHFRFSETEDMCPIVQFVLNLPTVPSHS